MADQAAAATDFPTPPPFYKHFTKQNLSRLQQLRKENDRSQTTNDTQEPRDHADTSQTELDVLALPPELRYLISPKPPADGKWRIFGVSHDLNAPELTLTEAGVEQLFPSQPSVKQNPQPHLIALARSLLTTFLALVGTLSRDPSLLDDRVQDLRTVVLNMHDLINQYRPHQARESLILMMEERVQKLRAECTAIGDAGEKIKRMMKELQKASSHHNEQEAMTQGRTDQVDAREIRRIKQREAWARLNAVT